MSHIHNIPMEQAVLTALMTVANSFDVVSNDLDVDCFFPERHKQIFTAIAELYEHGIGDTATVAARALHAGIDMDVNLSFSFNFFSFFLKTINKRFLA